MKRWVVCALLLASAPAWAKGRPKVMVLDLPQAEGLSASSLRTLDDYLAGAVREQGFDVVTPAQIGAVLGLDRQRQLLGCAESSCLAELGGALGVDYIVMGSVAMLESDSVVNLTAVNQKGTAVGSERRLVKGKSVEGFLHAFDELAPKLMAQAREGAGRPAPNLTSAEPKPQPEPAGGLEAHPAPSGRPTGAYVLMGAGAAVVVASVVVGALAKSSESQARSDAADPGKLSSDNSKTKTLALASTGLTVVGLGLAGGGAAWWLTAGDAQ